MKIRTIQWFLLYVAIVIVGTTSIALSSNTLMIVSHVNNSVANVYLYLRRPQKILITCTLGKAICIKFGDGEIGGPLGHLPYHFFVG